MSTSTKITFADILFTPFNVLCNHNFVKVLSSNTYICNIINVDNMMFTFYLCEFNELCESTFSSYQIVEIPTFISLVF